MIKTKWNLQTVSIDLLCYVTGSILYAMGIYTFAKMADFSPGGIFGLALIIHHLWNLPIGVTTLLLNIPLILLSWKVVGKHLLGWTVFGNVNAVFSLLLQTLLMK